MPFWAIIVSARRMAIKCSWRSLQPKQQGKKKEENDVLKTYRKILREQEMRLIS